MTDKDINRYLMEDTEFVLRQYFRHDPAVYVSANLFIYYTEGEPNDRVAPDVFVVKGVANHPRESYLLWVEKQSPQVVFEFVSRTSRLRDRGTKLGLYAALGVREYYVFDATGEWMTPPLRSFRLKADLFEEVLSPGGLYSPELDLDLVVTGSKLRLRRPGASTWLRTAEEEAERAEEEAGRAEEQTRRADRLADKLRALGIDPDQA